MSFKMLVIGFLFGIGFGYFVQRAGLCFAHGLAEIFMGKGKRIMRFFLIIFIISSFGFLLTRGLKPIGQLRGYGFYNVISGMLFGAGIILSGGCILGTLRQLGEGNLQFVVVFLCFIPGMALVVYVLNPLLEVGYHVQGILLSDLIPVAPVYIISILSVFALFQLILLRRQ